MIQIHLPAQLSSLAGGQRQLQVRAATLGAALAGLDDVAPMVRSQILDAEGNVRKFVGVFVDGQQIEAVGDGAQPLRDGAEVRVVMAVAGG